ncbi:MAG: 16S rRNA (guanine(966)-N(2))-methyltransferase RsmD [Casimicrobiaceae bacterium]
MQAKPSRLRIIGGTRRGRIVRFTAAPGLRPTPDRVRETLFNWLGQDLAGRHTCELYAGSGVLSLEALSRGAASAFAVDSHPAAVRALRDNASALGLEGLRTLCADAFAALARETGPFDVIFLDPPFAEDPWSRLFDLCAPRLAEGGYIYAEAGRALCPPPSLALHRHARAGHVHYHLLCRNQ